MVDHVSVTGAQGLEARLRAISPQHGGQKMMQRLAISTVREAKLLVHRKTGTLGRSIQPRSVQATEALVVATANYAAYVELGTRAHEITPKARKALRWAATGAGARLSGTPRKAAQRGELGGVRFAKRVHHPGTRPYPYLLPGAQKAVASSDGSDGILAQIVADWNGAA
jgi:hypothetical protein